MKIIFSLYDDINNPFYRGGGALATHQLALRLAKRGHDTKIICGNYVNAKDRTVNGVKYKHIGSKNLGPIMGQISFSLLLPFYVLTEKFNIWIENFVPPHSTNMLQIYTKQPVVG